MKILITGIHGFVGTHLVEALRERHMIYGLDIISSETNGIKKTFSWLELNQIPAVDVIIHLAGKAHDTKNTTEEKAYLDINVGLTKTIFDYFLKKDSKKFIFFSSVKAVADSVSGEYLTEEQNPQPQTPYGKSKLEAEQYILAKLQTSDSGVPSSSKKIYILRPCMIHGTGNKGNLNLLYKLVSKGIPWPLGAFENRRSFTSIDNLTWVLRQIIEKNIPGGVYQIADDEPLSTRWLIELIAESKGRKALIWNMNPNFIKKLAGVGDVFRLPLNSERLKKLINSYVVSNAKLKEVLEVRSMPVRAEEGMRKTLKTFKND